MDAREIAPGLFRWTAPHPEWDPDGEPGSPADWPQDVGCVLADVGGEPVLIDPLVPDDDWAWLDERIGERRVHVLLTIRFHSRSRDAVLGRYDVDDTAPPGVQALRIDPRETMYWLPGHGALVPGDGLIGDGHGGVRRCPESWFGDTLTDAEHREALQPLLALPVRYVLLSHGEPVLEQARDALAAAIRAPV